MMAQAHAFSYPSPFPAALPPATVPSQFYPMGPDQSIRKPMPPQPVMMMPGMQGYAMAHRVPFKFEVCQRWECERSVFRATAISFSVSCTAPLFPHPQWCLQLLMHGIASHSIISLRTHTTRHLSRAVVSISVRILTI